MTRTTAEGCLEAAQDAKDLIERLYQKGRAALANAPADQPPAPQPLIAPSTIDPQPTRTTGKIELTS